MTSEHGLTPTPGLAASPLRGVVAVLCVTEIVTWGILFYAFPVLSTTIRDIEGWSLTGLVACFNVAQVVADAAGLWVGQRIDRFGPRGVMNAGSSIGVLAVLVAASAPNLASFLIGWVAVGFAISGTLYAPAFAAVTSWAGAQRVKALTAVALVAGLASTVLAPVTALLVEQLSWRTTYLCLAVVLVGTIPLHWLRLTAPRTRRQATTTAPATAQPGDESCTNRASCSWLNRPGSDGGWARVSCRAP